MAKEKAKQGGFGEMIMLKQRMHWSERPFGMIFSMVMITLFITGSFFSQYLVTFLEGRGVYLDLQFWMVWIMVVPFLINILFIRLSQPNYAVTDNRVVCTKPFSKDIAHSVPLKDIDHAEIINMKAGAGTVNIYTDVKSGSRLMITKTDEFGVSSFFHVAKPDIFVNTINSARRAVQ